MGKTNAEICKNYYYRNKAAKAAEKQAPEKQQGLLTNKTVLVKKTGAERARACRLRKKMLAQANRSSVNEILPVSSTSNPQMMTLRQPPRLVTTGTNFNPSDFAMVSNIEDHISDISHNSFLSRVTYKDRYSVTTQAEVPTSNSRVLCNGRATSNNVQSTGMEQSQLSQARKRNQNLVDASNIHVLSNQEVIMNQEPPHPIRQGLRYNSAEQVQTREDDNEEQGVTTEIQDKYDILGKYVAEKVRQLEKQQIMYVERIIHEAIYEGQMGHLNINSQLVVNTETFVSGQSYDNKRMESGDTEIKVKEEVDTELQVEFDIGEESANKDETEEESRSPYSSKCTVKRKPSKETEAIPKLPSDVDNIKKVIITEENDDSQENFETQALHYTQPYTANVGESCCPDNARKQEECPETHSELQDTNVKTEMDIEENWYPRETPLNNVSAFKIKTEEEQSKVKLKTDEELSKVEVKTDPVLSKVKMKSDQVKGKVVITMVKIKSKQIKNSVKYK